MLTSFAHCSYCCRVKVIVENDSNRKIFDKVAYPLDWLNTSDTESRFLSAFETFFVVVASVPGRCRFEFFVCIRVVFLCNIKSELHETHSELKHHVLLIASNKMFEMLLLLLSDFSSSSAVDILLLSSDNLSAVAEAPSSRCSF